MKKPVTTLILASTVPVFAQTAQADIVAPTANTSLSTDVATFTSIRAVGDDVIQCNAPTPPEWTLHSSNDGEHPNGDEQHAIWLMNRARQDPAVEGTWLATSDNPDIAEGREFFNVDTELLKEEFSLIEPKPPAAPDCRLYEAAVSHSNQLILDDDQHHVDQLARIDASGFKYIDLRGNVFSKAESALNAHAAFNIDWADDPDGMLDTRGHRSAVMSIDGAYTNVGLALVPAAVTANVGPLVVTGNYAYANPNEPNHFNTFITGTVWEDDTGYFHNNVFDPGEGVSGATVTVEIIGGTNDTGYTTANTAAGGGYAIPVADGTYTVRFTGQGLASHEEEVVVAGSNSLLLDYEVFSQSTCDATNLISDPAVINGDIYAAGSETVICSEVSITINGATVEGPDGAANGAALGLRSPLVTIAGTDGHPFTVKNGAVFYITPDL